MKTLGTVFVAPLGIGLLIVVIGLVKLGERGFGILQSSLVVLAVLLAGLMIGALLNFAVFAPVYWLLGRRLSKKTDPVKHSDWSIHPEWLGGAGPFFVLGCISVLACLLLPLVARLQTADIRALYGFGLGAGVLGAILLFVFRRPLYQQRRFWTIGPMPLDRNHRRIYWLAYLFVAASVLLLGVVWLRTQG